MPCLAWIYIAIGADVNRIGDLDASVASFFVGLLLAALMAMTHDFNPLLVRWCGGAICLSGINGISLPSLPAFSFGIHGVLRL
jgi:hypothetical protein